MRIAIASDHIGYDLKKILIKELENMRADYQDYGTYSKERTDYPIWGERAARAVARGECDLGIIICGTGAGISMAANKINGIRAVVCSDCYTVELSRKHNDANMLAMGSQVVGPGLAIQLMHIWLSAKYDGGRHQNRINLINGIENNQKGTC